MIGQNSKGSAWLPKKVYIYYERIYEVYTCSDVYGSQLNLLSPIIWCQVWLDETNNNKCLKLISVFFVLYNYKACSKFNIVDFYAYINYKKNIKVERIFFFFIQDI